MAMLSRMCTRSVYGVFWCAVTCHACCALVLFLWGCRCWDGVNESQAYSCDTCGVCKEVKVHKQHAYSCQHLHLHTPTYCCAAWYQPCTAPKTVAATTCALFVGVTIS